jgi:lipopolysaccharide export system permease protein
MLIKVKKIDEYLLKRFCTLFLMTFLICIFILLMQFLWKHLVELVGKGIGWSVLAEFFVYAVFSLVPLALPLAILLASLMTFGNLGENFELTAMKASGISLFRIMRPLIIFISTICIGAFFFSNNVLPVTQTKLWTLIFSLREKSPELDIPVGEFYSGIGNGINIYVREKTGKTLKNLMIYDYTGGFENSTVLVADSGNIKFTSDDMYLKLTLFNGESFENLKGQRISNSPSSIPYRRENFKKKEIIFDFNTKLNRFNESLLQDQHISKNFVQLSHSIDSVQKVKEKRSKDLATDMVKTHFLGRENPMLQSIIIEKNITKKRFKNTEILFKSLSQNDLEIAANYAYDRARSMKDLVDYNKSMLEENREYIAKHEIERHRKFTLSFACLIFFFIGAPLGAIIKKGGLGMPIVISVCMFIVYYIIDNTGYKMAREGLWESLYGMWLSSSVLLPIGIFLSYKAAVDATLFNAEHYTKILGYIRGWFNKQKNNTNLND